MTQYGYDFSMALYAKLKERIYGRIYVKVTDDDELYIQITRRDGLDFEVYINRFSEKMLNGYTTDYATYEAIEKLKKYVMNSYFK